jgi:hypothetical protein
MAVGYILLAAGNEDEFSGFEGTNLDVDSIEFFGKKNISDLIPLKEKFPTLEAPYVGLVDFAVFLSNSEVRSSFISDDVWGKAKEEGLISSEMNLENYKEGSIAGFVFKRYLYITNLPEGEALNLIEEKANKFPQIKLEKNTKVRACEGQGQSKDSPVPEEPLPHSGCLKPYNSWKSYIAQKPNNYLSMMGLEVVEPESQYGESIYDVHFNGHTGKDTIIFILDRSPLKVNGFTFENNLPGHDCTWSISYPSVYVVGAAR